MNTTAYRYDCSKALKTPAGIRYFGPVDMALADKKIAELEKCLKDLGLIEKIDRDKVGVMIPPDWYVSKCSGQQLIPSKIDYRLCEAKGLVIQRECRKEMKPTKRCPCVCNVRSAVQDSWLIVTTPNMLLFKAELARLVLYPKYNNPWVVPVRKCLR
jgi:hypothetical protein